MIKIELTIKELTDLMSVLSAAKETFSSNQVNAVTESFRSFSKKYADKSETLIDKISEKAEFA